MKSSVVDARETRDECKNRRHLEMYNGTQCCAVVQVSPKVPEKRPCSHSLPVPASNYMTVFLPGRTLADTKYTPPHPRIPVILINSSLGPLSCGPHLSLSCCRLRLVGASNQTMTQAALPPRPRGGARAAGVRRDGDSGSAAGRGFRAEGAFCFLNWRVAGHVARQLGRLLF